jgi:general stress protein CsbA
MKNTRIIALICLLILWGIGASLLFKKGENNGVIIITAVIIIAGFAVKNKKKNTN